MEWKFMNIRTKKTNTRLKKQNRNPKSISTVEPWLSEPHGRHIIGSDKQEVQIDGVASKTAIGRAYGGR